MHRLLADADRVLAPSSFVAGRVLAHFPDLRLTVLAHPPRAEWLAAPVHCVRVLLLGGLSRIKGLEVLRACAEAARRQQLPLEFTPRGTPEQPIEQMPALPLQLRGPMRMPSCRTAWRWSADVLWFPGPTRKPMPTPWTWPWPRACPS
jgi:hypothetical protein